VAPVARRREHERQRQQVRIESATCSCETAQPSQSLTSHSVFSIHPSNSNSISISSAYYSVASSSSSSFGTSMGTGTGGTELPLFQQCANSVYGRMIKGVGDLQGDVVKYRATQMLLFVSCVFCIARLFGVWRFSRFFLRLNEQCSASIR
jgi:hypothetical protein